MKENWVYMPHPGHLCVAFSCRFRMNTYVNGYIISTVGEYFPQSDVLRVFLKNRCKYPKLEINENGKIVREKTLSDEQLEQLLNLQGDCFDDAYLRMFGFEEIGLNRRYETMVFKAKKEEDPGCQCCPWTADGDCLEMRGYYDARDAYEGHIEMCEKADKGTFED